MIVWPWYTCLPHFFYNRLYECLVSWAVHSHSIIRKWWTTVHWSRRRLLIHVSVPNHRSIRLRMVPPMVIITIIMAMEVVVAAAEETEMEAAVQMEPEIIPAIRPVIMVETIQWIHRYEHSLHHHPIRRPYFIGTCGGIAIRWMPILIMFRYYQSIYFFYRFYITKYCNSFFT